MKYMFFGLILLSGHLVSLAQDAIKLPFEIVHGTLAEYKKDKYLLFVTDEGDSIRYYDQKFRILVTYKNEKPLQSKTGKSKPFGWIEIGFSASNQLTNGQYTLSGGPALHATAGYIFSPWFAMGLSTGYETFNELRIIPFEASISGNLSRQSITPFYTLHIGHGYGKNLTDPNEATWNSFNTIEGGFRLSPSLGIKFSQMGSATFCIGMVSQHATYERASTDWRGNPFIYGETRTIRQMQVKMGFMF
ncbi:MAG: hypothetical protein OEY56_03400 [Cyclobacteriaceae bacterium]|nr:hypothetical protein [Cyclobacteriaceae bacterium]